MAEMLVSLASILKRHRASPPVDKGARHHTEKKMRVIGAIACLGLIALPSVAAAQESPKVHELKASPKTVHRGFFDATLKPILTIDSGDIVRLETVSGNPRYYERLGVPKEKIPAVLFEMFEGVE